MLVCVVALLSTTLLCLLVLVLLIVVPILHHRMFVCLCCMACSFTATNMAQGLCASACVLPQLSSCMCTANNPCSCMQTGGNARAWCCISFCLYFTGGRASGACGAPELPRNHCAGSSPGGRPWGWGMDQGGGVFFPVLQQHPVHVSLQNQAVHGFFGFLETQ